MAAPQVPALDMQGLRRPQVQNDEVAAILNGLQLDKAFFVNRLQPGAMTGLLPKVPQGQVSLDHLVNSAEPGKGILKEGVKVKADSDFDIYLNEALMPVLAQALDALTRQLARMEKQGDALDPKVRARFNPLTFLGQQLLRRHPKCARTPRRHALYRNFKDWADFERGRREMLRKRELVKKVFNGFMLKGTVHGNAVQTILEAIDDTLHLNGVMKNHPEMQTLIRLMMAERPGEQSGNAKKRAGGIVTFEKFWYHLSSVLMAHDIVPYSALEKGKMLQAKEEEERMAWAESQAQLEEERQRKEEEQRRLMMEYSVLYEKLKVDANLRAILEEQKILTGDDVRPGDAGFEFEVPPKGPHVSLLASLLVLLGFSNLEQHKEDTGDLAKMQAQPTNAPGAGIFRASAQAVAKETKKAASAEDDRYWDADLGSAWMILQKVFHSELVDGVVEGEVLQQVLVPPVGFTLLRGKVEDEFERSQDDGTTEKKKEVTLEEKPSMEVLCQRHGITMARLEWLHDLFESFLEHDPDPNAPPPCCLYPECPASLNRDQMRSLISEVEPNISENAFNARFTRIDTDGSGLIEFDEFVQWVSADEVKIAGHTNQLKMTFEELARHYKEPYELINYLHNCFQDQMPLGVTDQYPDEPVGLEKNEAWNLAQMLTPSVDNADFEKSFTFVDSHSRQAEHCDFDEFLEILDFSQLPAELRDRLGQEEGQEEN